MQKTWIGFFNKEIEIRILKIKKQEIILTPVGIWFVWKFDEDPGEPLVEFDDGYVTTPTVALLGRPEAKTSWSIISVILWIATVMIKYISERGKIEEIWNKSQTD